MFDSLRGSETTMKKIAIVTTMWTSIRNWITPFLDEYYKSNIDITLICNMDSKYKDELVKNYPYVHIYSIPFPRGVKFFQSLKSYRTLKKYLKAQEFDLIQYSTPNASFYASLAAKKAKIPVRLYCQWGMVFMSMKGIKKRIFRFLEKCICKWSTNIQPDSRGNLNYCRLNNFYSEKKSELIWNGSAKGVNFSKYDIAKKNVFRSEIRKMYGIQTNDLVMGFVGRLGRDKGCHELIDAFRHLKSEFPNLKLLFIGPLEKQNTIDKSYLEYFLSNNDIIKTGRIEFVEKAVCAMDVFVLPSYREGFGMSVLEASSMEIPVIATRFPGPEDTIIDGKTGYLCDVKNVDQIVTFVKNILLNSNLASELGKNGRKFVRDNFEQSEFIQKTIDNRKKLLKLE